MYSYYAEFFFIEEIKQFSMKFLQDVCDVLCVCFVHVFCVCVCFVCSIVSKTVCKHFETTVKYDSNLLILFRIISLISVSFVLHAA